MKKTCWFQAITPLHIGVGKGLNYIDMPISREKVTNWPFIPSSAIKGVLKDYFANSPLKNKIDIAFGKEVSDTDSQQGALVFTNANIICLAVRSLYGTFAWICSSVSLNRLKRDMLTLEINNNLPAIPEVNGTSVLVSQTSKLKPQNQNFVYLEDLDLQIQNDNQQEFDAVASFIADNMFSDDIQKEMFKARFAIVGEEVFNFLCETGTEVMAHNSIDNDTKITKGGALWYEESLPAESILAGFVWDQPLNEFSQNLANEFCPQDSVLNLQLGGKNSVGKGQVSCKFK